jgi:hypothetical protein
MLSSSAISRQQKIEERKIMKRLGRIALAVAVMGLGVFSMQAKADPLDDPTIQAGVIASLPAGQQH